MKIRLLLTGGTIDKKYDALTGNLVFTETHAHEMLKQARSRLEVVVDQLMLIDSLEMTNEQRQVILEHCQKVSESIIVITHGTDTMAETAEVLGNGIQGKTIILCGAMIPYSFSNSDAEFNLGAALMAAQLLGEGVYIAMNGRVFDWDNVKKNKTLGEFQELS